jgi:hypothetical protein
MRLLRHSLQCQGSNCRPHMTDWIHCQSFSCRTRHIVPPCARAAPSKHGLPCLQLQAGRPLQGPLPAAGPVPCLHSQPQRGYGCSYCGCCSGCRGCCGSGGQSQGSKALLLPQAGPSLARPSTHHKQAWEGRAGSAPQASRAHTPAHCSQHQVPQGCHNRGLIALGSGAAFQRLFMVPGRSAATSPHSHGSAATRCRGCRHPSPQTPPSRV